MLQFCRDLHRVDKEELIAEKLKKWLFDVDYLLDGLREDMTGEARRESYVLLEEIRSDTTLPPEMREKWISEIEKAREPLVQPQEGRVGTAMFHLGGIRRELKQMLAEQESREKKSPQEDRRAILLTVAQEAQDFEIILSKRFGRVQPLPNRIVAELEITGGYYSAMRGDDNSFANVETIFPPPPFIDVYPKSVYRFGNVLICRGKNLACNDQRDILHLFGPAHEVYEMVANEFLSEKTGLLRRAPYSLDTDLGVALGWWKDPRSVKVIASNSIYEEGHAGQRPPQPSTDSNLSPELYEKIREIQAAHLREMIRIEITAPKKR